MEYDIDMDSMDSFPAGGDMDMYGGAEIYTSGDAGAAAALGGFILITYLVVIVIYWVVFGLSYMKIAKTLNYDKPWMAWIPILNFWQMVELAGKPAWWILLFFVPIANIVVMVIVNMEIAKRLNKPEWVGVVAALAPSIIPFLGLAGPLYMAYGSSDGGMPTGGNAQQNPNQNAGAGNSQPMM